MTFRNTWNVTDLLPEEIVEIVSIPKNRRLNDKLGEYLLAGSRHSSESGIVQS